MNQDQLVYRKVFEFTTDCCAIYQSVNGGDDFIFKDFNPAAERAENIKRETLLGKSIKEVFPEVVSFGLFDVMQKVYHLGKSKYLPIKFYKDKRISGWRENWVHRLPDKQILVIYKDLTSVKLNAEEERVQDHVFHQFIKIIPEIVCETNLEGRILFGNQKTYETFGIKPGDIEKGLYLRQFFKPTDLRRVTVNFEKIIRGKEISSQRYEVIGKNGNSFPIIAHTSLVYKEGKPTEILFLMTDISEREAAEEKLQKEKDYLEEMIFGVPEAIIQTSKNGNVVKVNNEFTKLFGYTSEEVLGKNIDRLLGQSEFFKSASEVSRKVIKGEQVAMEGIRYKKNGKPVNVNILAKPVIYNDQITGAYAIYFDITETKSKQAHTKLLLDISTDALNSDNIEGLLTEVRERLGKFLDTTNLFIAIYNQKDQTLSFPYFVDEKDKFESVPAKNTLTGYVIKTRKPHLITEKEIKSLEKKGEITLVGTPSKIWLGVPLFSPEGIMGVISLQSYSNENAFTKEDLNVMLFVSNQIGLAIYKIKTKEALEIAKQKAEEVAITKQQFLSTMSHEIRTPLNAVIGMSQLLMDLSPRSDQMEYLSALKYSGENLMALINDILDYNKLESEKVVLEKVVFSLEEVIQRTIQMLGFKAKERNNILSYKVESKVHDFVLGDKIRLIQILTNLIGNAIKFTENGKIHLQVSHLSSQPGKNKIEFSVKDNGIGIEPEKQKLIFDSFTQAKSDITRRFGGSGLGLAISKKLVELQGGDISVKSIYGEGSTFSFSVVYEKVKKKAPPKQKGTAREIDLSNKKVLIVEDNAINRLVAKRFLEGWKVKVEEAEDGELAIEKVKQYRPDLILMDLQMPIMDGYEATKRIKSMENGTFHSIPIIALSASVLLDVKEQIKEAGLDDFLLKPFQASDLQDMLFKHLL